MRGIAIIFFLFFMFSGIATADAISGHTTNVQGTDVIFLAGRTDVTIPPLGSSDPFFPILRHWYVNGDFIQETFPQFTPAVAGMSFSFSASGYVHYFNGYGYGSGYGPDGYSSSSLYSLAGISGYTGPAGALVGVFLDDSNPASSSPPETLDFFAIGTSFETLSPKLGQVFFIGDGLTDGGNQQVFVAPEGTTRLFLGIPDGWGFYGAPGYYEDNDGYFSVNVSFNLPGACMEPPAGMISWWTGDLTANDSVGGHNGTLVNGATFAQGKEGPAFSFGSAGDMVAVPDSPALNLESLSASSFEGWFKSNGGSVFGDALIIGKHTCGFPNGWFFNTGQGCHIGDIFVGGYGVGNLNLDDGRFHHFSCVKNGTNYREYIDGVLIGESTGPDTGTPNSEPVMIGSITTGGGVCYPEKHQLYGVADELSLYNRALDADEIRAIYMAGAEGKCKPEPATCVQPPADLVSWWPAEGNGIDLMGRNPGTLTGTTTFGTGMVGQAFAFPATFDGVLIPNSPSLQLQSFTIDAWVKRGRLDVAGPGPSCNEGEIFVYGYGGYGLGMCGNGSLFLTQVGIDAVHSGPVVTDTAWHQVAATKTADGTVFFYVDGIAVGPFSYNPTFYFNTPTAIGNRGDSIADPASGNPPANFYGLIDEVEIFSRALAAEEIRNIYLAGSAGKCKMREVAIDIKPGSFPNSINLGSGGTVAVAIFSTSTVDATMIDPLSVTLAGASVQLKGKGTPMSSFEDVNGDGLPDLVVHVSTEALQLSETDAEAVLLGQTFSGTSIKGVDTVRIVPPVL